VATIRPLSEALTSTSVDLPEGAPVVAVEDLALRFGGTRAVGGVSVEVAPRELVGTMLLLGPLVVRILAIHHLDG
jgi:hypothetical protein